MRTSIDLVAVVSRGVAENHEPGPGLGRRVRTGHPLLYGSRGRVASSILPIPYCALYLRTYILFHPTHHPLTNMFTLVHYTHLFPPPTLHSCRHGWPPNPRVILASRCPSPHLRALHQLSHPHRFGTTLNVSTLSRIIYAFYHT